MSLHRPFFNFVSDFYTGKGQRWFWPENINYVCKNPNISTSGQNCLISTFLLWSDTDNVKKKYVYQKWRNLAHSLPRKTRSRVKKLNFDIVYNLYEKYTLSWNFAVSTCICLYLITSFDGNFRLNETKCILRIKLQTIF